MTSAQVFLVLCTAPVGEARCLADRLLEERLVACVNLLGPVASRYHWEDTIEESEELILLMKTSANSRERLRQRIADLHSYSVPEVLEFAADSGLPAYLEWVLDSCRDQHSS